MRLSACLFASTLFLAAACGGSSKHDDGPDADPGGGNTGTISGVVMSESASGSGAIAGAVVSIDGGASTVSDEYGNFALDGVPAGEVNVVVRGPRASDPDHPFVYTTWRGRVSVVAGETAPVGANLLQGCERFLDAEAGGTIDVANCGNSGAGSLTFPANALVRQSDSSAFAGLVRVVVAVADPAVPTQLLAFPETENPMDDALFGGIEVRLTDAIGGDALQVASGSAVDVAVELHDDAVAVASDLEVRWFDPGMGAWVTEPPGAVETIGNRPHYRFSATHFTARAVRYQTNSSHRACLNVTVNNFRGAVLLQFASGGQRWYRSAVASVNNNGDIQCVDAPPNTTLSVRVLGTRWNFPGSVLTAWKTVTTGNAYSTCDTSSSCERVRFHVGNAGCLDGRFQSGACSSPSDNHHGEVRFSRDNRVFATRAGNVCDMPFYTLMVPHGDGGVVISDSFGSQRVVNPPSGSSCININGIAGSAASVAARHHVAVQRSITAGTAHATNPGSAFGLDLDGAQSSGAIHTYAWDVFAVGEGGDTLVWSQSTASPSTNLRVDAGRYRTRLRVYSGADLVASESKLTDVSSDPAPTASFTVSSAMPIVGESVHVDASGSSDNGSITSYQWDFDGDMVFDATGVTATHVYNTEGPQQIRLRVTDDAGQINEAVINVTVQANLPANTLQLTITGNGTVTGTGGFTCTGPATCTHTYPGPTQLLLEAFNPDGTPAHMAWGNQPNADGHQLFTFINGTPVTLTATF